MDSEKLAEAFHEHRCLWELSKAVYKDMRKKENAWKAVASKVNSITVVNWLAIYLSVVS